MKKDEVLESLRSIGDDVADMARKHAKEGYYQTTKDYKALRWVIKNIDKLYNEEV